MIGYVVMAILVVIFMVIMYMALIPDGTLYVDAEDPSNNVVEWNSQIILDDLPKQKKVVLKVKKINVKKTS